MCHVSLCYSPHYTQARSAHIQRERERDKNESSIQLFKKKRRRSSSCFVAVVTNRNGLPDLKNVNTDCTPVCVYPITTQP